MIFVSIFIVHYFLHKIRIIFLSIWGITVSSKIIPFQRNTPSLGVKKTLLLEVFLFFYLFSTYKLLLYQKSPDFADFAKSTV